MGIDIASLNCYSEPPTSEYPVTTSTAATWNYHHASTSSTVPTTTSNCQLNANHIPQPFEFNSPSSSQSNTQFTSNHVPRYDYPTAPPDTYDTSPLTTGDCVFQPEEIFQLDQPLKSSSTPSSHNSYFNNNNNSTNNNNHLEAVVASGLHDLDSRHPKVDAYYGGHDYHHHHHHHGFDAATFFEQNYIPCERTAIKVEPNTYPTYSPEKRRTRKFTPCASQYEGDYERGNYYETTPLYQEGATNPYLSNTYANYAAGDSNHVDTSFHY